MTKKEIRNKIIKRKKILSLIFTIILSPILLPLFLLHKLGELSEIIANIIQIPFMKIINILVSKYKLKLEKLK